MLRALIITIFASVIPIMAFAQERLTMGDKICREEHLDSLSAREICYDDWLRSALLVNRYVETYVDNASVWDTFMSALLANPFKLNRQNLFGNCSAGQLLSGNLWDNEIDFRKVWDCIARHDKEAAKWDMI